VVIGSRANYARGKCLMAAIKSSEALELQLIVGASALLYRFGKVVNVIEEDGFAIDERIHYVVEGENLSTQAKSTGLGIIELSTAFSKLVPDVVVTIADRFETLATAVASSYLNIPLAHVQGGEVSGNIDEAVRHAITKLAHLHFPSTEQSRERILRMGEEEWRVHNTGCPSMDIIRSIDLRIDNDFFERNLGTGIVPDPAKPYILLVYHPVTTSFGHGRQQVEELLAALKQRPEQKIVLWPNIDAGSDDVSKGIREFREETRDGDFGYFINFSPEDYVRLLNAAACAVGNSSSFIREGSTLGVPAVVTGDRQEGREHGRNAVFCELSKDEVLSKLDCQIRHGRYEAESIFGDGRAGQRIATLLADMPLTIKKRITY
jgi:UDP-hydrolysing UDP-N-acetyl-D-glucosamine 2-epimerase